MPTAELKAYKNNAKVHTVQQIEAIKKSIEEFGMNDPIAIWKDNEIIEGHGRLTACSELGIESVPVIRLDNLTDKQRKAYAIVHNKLTMNTPFNIDILGEELKTVMDDIDFTQLGFGDFELESLTTDFEPEGYDKEIEDKYSGYGDNFLNEKRVIINYTDETEESLKALLGVEGELKVRYEIAELLAPQDSES